MKHIQVLMDALSVHANHYNSVGDYSATTLIDPPRLVRLKKRYGHLVQVDPEMDMASFIGTGVHAYFENTLKIYNGVSKKYQLEQQMVMNIKDRLVSGTFDIMIDNKHVFDIKTAKVWKKIFDPDMEHWHQQQNIYAHLLRSRGVDVESLNIIAVYLDWQKNMALRDRFYPQDRVEQYTLNLWSPERAEAFLNERLDLHIAEEKTPDDELPACTPEERWERFQGGGIVQYALLKTRDAKRAMKVESTVQALKEYAATKNVAGDAVVEIRHARRTRCEDWCEIAPWCNHYQQYLADKINDNLNDYVRLGDL